MTRLSILFVVFILFTTETIASIPAGIPETGSPSIPSPVTAFEFRLQRLTLKERIVLKIFRRMQKKAVRKGSKADLKQKAQWSLVLGIAGIVFIFLPFGLLLSVGAIITALILGYQVRREDPKNKMARAGIILGWLGVATLIAAIGIAIATLL